MAVDGQSGELFVSELGTGRILRFAIE